MGNEKILYHYTVPPENNFPMWIFVNICEYLWIFVNICEYSKILQDIMEYPRSLSFHFILEYSRIYQNVTKIF